MPLESTNFRMADFLEFHKYYKSAYFQVREINNIKCQNLVIFSFKIRIKLKFSLSATQPTHYVNPT